MPLLLFCLLLVGAAGVAAGQPAVPASGVVTIGVQADTTFSTFWVRRIPRSEFPLAGALATKRAGVRRGVMSGTPAVDEMPSAGSSLGLWDELSLDFSRIQNHPASGSTSYEGQYGLDALRVLPFGRLKLEARLGDRDDRRYLAKGSLGFAAPGGTRIGVGDAPIQKGGTALQGVTARGFHLDRPLFRTGSSGRLRVGLVAGRTPLHTRNLEESVYPRDLAAGVLQLEGLRKADLSAQAFFVSDRDETNEQNSIRDGGGAALSVAHKSERMTAGASLFRSDYLFQDHARETGTELHLRGRRNQGAWNIGMSFQTTEGTAYRIGSLGSLQPVPQSILEGDLVLRGNSRWSVGVWAGQWKQPPGRVEKTAIDGEFGQEALIGRNRASEGRQWGGRASWKLQRTGTGLSISREERWRDQSTGRQEVIDLAVSVSQRISRGANLSVWWNELRDRRYGPNNYLTGDLTFPIGRGGSVTLQQRTVWQEPVGARLISIAEISSLRLWGDRLSASAQLAQTHEQAGRTFSPIQTMGRFAGHVRLAKGITLSPRYEIRRSGSNEVHSFQLAFIHSASRGPAGVTSVGTDPRGPEPQLLKGVVFEDRNCDGVRQNDEPPVPGVAIVVDGDIRGATPTDSRGHYRTFLSVGRHVLRILPESVPVQYRLEGLGPVEIDIGLDGMVESDFGLVRRVGAIVGRLVQEDPGAPGGSSANGVVGVPNVRVLLNGLDFTYTDADGRFAFRYLPAGSYELCIDPKTVPFGFRVEGGGTRVLKVGTDTGDARVADFVLTRPIQRKVF